MPTLKATGRGRLGPANQAAPPPPGNNNKPIGGTASITRTPSTESSQWKPKTLNGSTSSSSINRGPPPQPPPANRKPTAIVIYQFHFNSNSIKPVYIFDSERHDG